MRLDIIDHLKLIMSFIFNWLCFNYFEWYL